MWLQHCCTVQTCSGGSTESSHTRLDIVITRLDIILCIDNLVHFTVGSLWEIGRKNKVVGTLLFFRFRVLLQTIYQLVATLCSLRKLHI